VNMDGISLHLIMSIAKLIVGVTGLLYMYFSVVM
jgi:hypothetical protein